MEIALLEKAVASHHAVVPSFCPNKSFNLATCSRIGNNGGRVNSDADEPSGTVPISGTTAAVVGPGSGHHAAWSGLSPSRGRFSNTLLVGWVRR